MRAAVGIGGVLIALCLWALGRLFSLNGGNWDWWQAASSAAALIVLALTAWLVIRGPRPSRFRAAWVIGGLAVSVTTALVAGTWFNDSYYGSPVWPHALAVVAFAGVLAALAGGVRSLT